MMTDNDGLSDIRTRIANIVDAQKPILNYRHCEMVADAVIAELQPELKSLERLAQWQAAPRLPIRGALFDPESWDSWEGHRR